MNTSFIFGTGGGSVAMPLQKIACLSGLSHREASHG
jgi:hypothetical protein